MTSNVIKALQWAVANKATYGIDIINLSLGHPIFEPAASDPLVQAVEAAVRSGHRGGGRPGNNGIKPTTGLLGLCRDQLAGQCAVGDHGRGRKTYDTTTRTDDLVADYSSRGPTWYDAFAKPDLVAPGHRLLGRGDDGPDLYTTYPDAARHGRWHAPYLT